MFRGVWFWLWGGAGITTPVADFSGTPLSGLIPLSVAFTDLSTNTPTSWSWTATGAISGTVYTSTDQNPTIVFAVADTYSVTLAATNAAGTGTTTKSGYIVASPVPYPIILDQLNFVTEYVDRLDFSATQTDRLNFVTTYTDQINFVE